ncbi:ABC transporter permease [Williamsoniiplasma lucivorax]|uniref:Ribose/galactose ABC transporter permease n=1 Tax=Williamsoniiplasma lucivorax TaxID=209274 RepID=A0A2S5RDW7_9MOLU|nr:ABC transporter permease [Williamsoniiplasma lucivorax]PPE05511.1 ribose/galactose ABC transporter permease [Williamsoniiplasma lucivorax]
MNKFKQQKWFFTSKLRDVTQSNEFQKRQKYLKGSILAIIAGFVVSGILLATLNVNPFDYFYRMFNVAFSELYISQTFNWMAIFIVGGVAVAIGFKTGVFNIGAPGQILAATSVSTIVLFSLVPKDTTSVEPSMILLLFLVSVVSGAFMAFIAGILKAMCNIHEVVTTILLNWFIWYLFKWIFVSGYPNQFGSTSLPGASMEIPSGMLNIGENEIIIPLLIAGGIVVIATLLFLKTTFGFKLKAVGNSSNAAKYSGINVKQKIIIAMTMSGAIAGVAGFISMATLNPNTFFANDNLPTMGFDVIAISLIAFNNPVGMIFIGGLWGVIQNAGAPISSLYGIPTQIAGLVTGIILYFAAISVIFMMFKPQQFFKMWIYLLKAKTERKALWLLYCKKYRLSLRKTFIKFDKEYRQAIKTTQTLIDEKIVKMDFQGIIKLELNQISAIIKALKKQLNEKNTTQGFAGIRNRYLKNVQQIHQQTRTMIEDEKFKLNLFKTELGEYQKQQINWLAMQNKQAKKTYKKAVKQAQEFYKGELGNISFAFQYRDHKTTLKSTLAKQHFNIRENIINLKSNAKMQINATKHDQTLSKNSQFDCIKMIKKQLKAQVKIENIQIKTLQFETKLAMRAAKKQASEQMQLLKKEAVKLKQLKQKLLADQMEAKTIYKTCLNQNKQENHKRNQQVDLLLSDEKINQASKIIMNLETELAQFNVQDLQTYTMIFKKIEQANKKINLLLTNKAIEIYDAPEKMVDRIELVVKLHQMKYQAFVGYEILKAQLAMALEKHKYQTTCRNLKLLKQETKQKLSVLHKTNKRCTFEQLKEIMHQKDALHLSLEATIRIEEQKNMALKEVK